MTGECQAENRILKMLTEIRNECDIKVKSNTGIERRNE